MEQRARLEDEIDDLLELDRCRERAEALLKQGFEGLTGERYDTTRSGWTVPGDLIERGLLVRCLVPWKLKGELEKSAAGDETFRAALDSLLEIDLDPPRSPGALDSFGHPERDKIPVFRAATVLRALSATGTHALSEAGLRCLLCIVRELHTPNAPNWTVGGARGDDTPGADKGPETAFMTLRCVQAVLELADLLDRTREYLRAAGKPAAVDTQTVDADAWAQALGRWTTVDEERRQLSLEITRVHQIPNLACGLENHGDEATAFVARIVAQAQEFMRAQLECALQSPPNERKEETASGTSHRLGDKESLWTKFLLVFDADASDVEMWLSSSATALRDLLTPSARYLSDALDHQISETHVRVGSTCDVAEMIFAAYGVGLLSSGWSGDAWDDPRFATVLEVIKATLTDDGRVPSQSPFDVAGKGYVLTVASIEVSSSLAQLLTEIDYRPEAAAARKILRLFESTRTKNGGWRHERNAGGTCDWWLSALAVDALRDVTRMLNKWINRRVLRHLSHRRPNEFNLDDLFYPDYALSKTQDLEGNPRKSLAIELLRMRGHVLGRKILDRENLHSLVLYGPPGTGKTTLLEALASSCEVPFVEITPSDLLAGGAEQVERRARALFTALSLLSDVVILFDEFDSILRRRVSSDPTPATIFAFLTPGMLPKFKNLHSRAKHRRVAYALATNLVGTLDEAAIREGRFDVHAGVFPPDLLSRVGRLLSQLERIDGARLQWNLDRILEVINETSGGPMSRLGKKGWFTAASWKTLKHVEKGTVFDYVLKNGDRPAFPPREKDFKSIVVGEGPRAREETAAWAFVDLFDREDASRAVENGERPPRVPTWKALETRLSDDEVKKLETVANKLGNVAQIEGDDVEAAEQSVLERRFLRAALKKLESENGAT